MTPGRRKGGSRAKSKEELGPGDLVLAKVKGFPAWPAKISRPEDFSLEPEPQKFFVQFYATCEIGFVAPADIQVLTCESKRKLFARAQGKTIKYFARAVEEICDAFEKEHKNSSDEPGEVNDENAIALVSSSTLDNENRENLEHHEAFHMDAQVARGSDNATIKKEESKTEMGISKTELVPLLLVPELSCQKEENSISPCPCTSEVKVAQSKSPVVIGGKSLGGCEEEHTDVVDNTFAIPQFDSEKVCNVKKPVKVNVHDKLKSITTPKVNTPRKKTKLQMPRLLKEYSTKGREKFDASCEVVHELRGNVPSLDVDVDDTAKVKGTKRLEKLSEKKLLHAGLERLMPDKDERLLHEGSSFSRGEKLHSIRNRKREIAASGCSQQAKRLKRSEGGSDMPGKVTKKIRQSASENRLDTIRKTKKSANSLKGHANPLAMIEVPEIRNNKSADETLLLPSEQCQTLKAISKSSIKNSISFERNSGKGEDDIASNWDMSPMTDSISRKRKFQVDDEDEEQRTPVYKESTNCDMPTMTHFRRRTFRVDDSENEKKKTPVYTESDKVSLTTYSGTVASMGDSSSQAENNSISLRNANHFASKYRNSSWEDKSSRANMTSVQVGPDSPSGCREAVAMDKNNEKNVQLASSKFSSQACESLNHTHNEATLLKMRVPSPLEKDNLMATPNLKMATTDERLETTSLADSKFAESSTSMKHLIAAAQAKMKLSHTQSRIPDCVISGPVPTPPLVHGRSDPIPVSVFHVLTPGNSVNTDAQGCTLSKPLVFPGEPSHQLSYTNQGEIENCAHSSPSNIAREGSLSGSIEVVVARGALEGMIETLTRTKESIRRATRLAIDCAKYGIAGEVIDLVIRKLEEESSIDRKVDLLFLVDSITQRSHSQKGIAGSSYIPVVQAALPRLLVAAAPFGASARENRRQCLKVLRLWLERKIMPEAVLRQCMNDIEVANDEKDFDLSLECCFQADQSVDDPIREMEVAFFDEYGSNATLQLPCSLSTNVSLPSDKHHHILEDVEGELEMEDVPLNPPPLPVNHPSPSPPLPRSPPAPPLPVPPPILTPSLPPLPSPVFSPLPSCSSPVIPSFPPSVNQGTLMTHGPGAVSANIDVGLLQSPTFGTTNLGAVGFTPRTCESGHNDKHDTSLVAHPNPQFEFGSGSFQQRPYPSLPPWQAPTNYPHQAAHAPPNHPLPTTRTLADHFSYVNTMNREYDQQPYYPYPQAHPSGRGQYLPNVQRNASWVVGGIGSSSPGVHFPQDGFYMSNMEKPHQNSVYEHPHHNSVSSGPSVPGFYISNMERPHQNFVYEYPVHNPMTSGPLAPGFYMSSTERSHRNSVYEYPLHNSMSFGPSAPVSSNHMHPHQWPPFDVPAHNWRPT